MTLEDKKIRREARRNQLLVVDLRNAVKAVRFQKDDNYGEADVYKSLVIEDSKRLWEVAGNVVQYFSDTQVSTGEERQYGND